MLVAPRSTPPAAQAIARTKPAPRRTFVSGGKLIAPTFIPQNVAILKEEPLPPDVGVGVVGGVPGGVPGGQLGGVIGGIITDAARTNVPLPAPTAVQPRAPVRVGGRIETFSTHLAGYPCLPSLGQADSSTRSRHRRPCDRYRGQCGRDGSRFWAPVC